MNDNIFSSDSNEIQDSVFISSDFAEQVVDQPIAVEAIVAEPVIEATPVVEAALVVEPQIETPVVEQIIEPVKPKPAKKAKVEGETVALYSTHNLHQSKHGELTIGYNIVAKEKADFWLRSKKVRLATPEEVASHYNR
jgi:hypothetical protein